MTTAAEFQQLPRPQQKLCLWEAHEKGIGPRALSHLTLEYHELWWLLCS